MEIPKHWKLFLDGMNERECESGDVIYIADGEIIGTWHIIDDVFYSFTPNGATEHLFFEPFLGMLCEKVRDWHEEREGLIEASN